MKLRFDLFQGNDFTLLITIANFTWAAGHNVAHSSAPPEYLGADTVEEHWPFERWALFPGSAWDDDAAAMKQKAT